MNNSSNFDPNTIAKSLEEWQKFWQASFYGNNQDMGKMLQQQQQAWQNLMQQQMQFWQGGLSSTAANTEKDDKAASAGNAWMPTAFFEQIQKMYETSRDMLESQTALMTQNLSAEQQDNIQYMTRLYLKSLNPQNYFYTNPDAIQAAVESNGMSIINGIQNYIKDMEKGRISQSDDTFVIGENIAATPGQVVLKNELIELIQYTPTTAKVYEKPLVIVPPCVNKYYLMDLGPQKSMAEYMVSQGYTTFLISWRSATEETKHFTWDTYVERGVIAAIRAACNISKQDSVNTLGFCIGGILLNTALCVLKGRGEPLVSSAINMASLLDHTLPGDIKYFVTEDLVKSREAKMEQGGIVSGLELQATFSALRADDLIWHYVRENYLKGKKPSAFDLLYWNNDSVDLPLPMHTFFLRKFYLENAFAHPGKISVCGVPVDLSTIDIPMYFFAAEGDHIVLWKGVYNGIKYFSNAPERRFVLGESGHIAGAINPVSKDRRSYWVGDNLNVDADTWLKNAENRPGSWWKDAAQWLSGRSGKQIAAPKTAGNSSHQPLYAAPGEYVMAKALPVMLTHMM